MRLFIQYRVLYAGMAMGLSIGMFTSSTTAQIEIVAIEDGAVPGLSDEFFDGLDVPMIDDQGGVYFFATWGVTLAEEGVIAHQAGQSSVVIQGGDSFDSIPIVLDRTWDVIVSSSGMTGGIVVLANVRNAGATDECIVRVTDTGANLIHRDGDPVPVGTGNAFIRNSTLPSISSRGDVGFPVLLSNTPNGTSDDRAIFRYNPISDSFSRVVQEGDLYPEQDGTFEGSCGGSLDLFCTPLVNNSGEAMFIDVDGVYLEESGSVDSVARIGQLVGGETFDDIDFPKFNDNGQIAFSSDIFGNSSNDAVFINDDGDFSSVVIGDPAPSSAGPIVGIHRSPMRTQVQMNNLGEVVFGSDTFEPDSEGGNRIGEGLFVFDGSTTRCVARSFEPAPGGGTYEIVHWQDSWTTNDAGQVLFMARVSVPGRIGATQTVFFLYTPGEGVERLIGIGDVIDGMVVTDLTEPNTGYRSAGALNSRGEVTLRVRLDNDRTAIILINGLPSCAPDLNQDGNLDFFDISAFLTAFSNQDPIADFNDDGGFDFFDISAFLTAFSGGCP